ncbi:FMRFamide receptor [Toxocara canis]|uniref:FMRFamide receptor n=1 Tax=Toxocara canis TaxID=6265 RepID=A0A0B2W1B8_TOXCA|nr:FMRFamide receptor [Toxocara canis]
MSSVLNGPITAFVVAVGVLLNFLTISTLLRIQRRRGAKRQLVRECIRPPVIYTYFFWIAYTDSALLISALLMYCLPALLDGSFETYVRFFPACYMLSNATLTASVWLMCAMMYDRYRALCRPLYQRISFHNRRSPTRRVHVVCIMMLLLGLIYSLPRLFELSVVSVQDTLRVVQTSLVSNRFYMVGYRIVGGLLFYSLLPYVILSVISARVSYAVHRASVKRRTISKYCRKSLRSQSSDSERILLVIMAKFLISRLLPTALDITEHIIGQENFLLSSTVTTVVDICDLIVVLASATNFFIYCALSRSFRRSLTSQCYFDCLPIRRRSHKSNSVSLVNKGSA